MLINLRGNSCQYNRHTGSRGIESCEGYTMKQVFPDRILDRYNFLILVYFIHLNRHTHGVAHQERHVLVVPIHSIQLEMVHMLEAGLHTTVPWEVNMVVEHHIVNHL